MCRLWKRGLSVFLASAMMVPATGQVTEAKTVMAAEMVTPDFEWDFESDISSSLKGSAKVEVSDVAIEETTYSKSGNHVLTLEGGVKGSSYAELPSDLYKGVSAETGFSYSFWMKASLDVSNYSRLISSATSKNENEFAFTPYASDKVWNVIFDSDNLYRAIYSSEPAKNVWNYITFTVDEEEVVFYVNGEKVNSSSTVGGMDELTANLNRMEDLTVNAIGKTCSGWGDSDCKAQVDDFRFYKKALSAEEVAEIANTDYGFTAEVKDENVFGGESEYMDGTELTAVQLGESTSATSPDEKTAVKILTDSEKKSFYYSVGQNDKNVLQASALGIVTEGYDFSKNVVIKNIEISSTKTEEYDLPAGKQSHVKESYREMSFDLVPSSGDSEKKCTVIFRIYNDGIAFRYQVYGTDGAKETIRSEASEYVLPYNGTKLWLGGTSKTYEVDYSSVTMKSLTSASSNYTIPALASTADGSEWVLLTEANVFNEEEPYCSSYLSTESGKRNLKVTFGNNVSTVKMTYEDGSFHTPWRVAVITDDLETLVNSNMVTNLNPEADEETYQYSEWVKSFKADWSWWSEAGDDPIEYAPQKDYIDFAAENGWDAVCLDFGWCLWDDYKEKVKELCQYAAEKNIKIMLWYGVNNTGHAWWKDENGKAAYPTYSLRTTEQLKEQFEWAHETGVYAVKVDYYESDTQETMKQMEECAKIAAQNKLCVLFHGCTMPGGENRTYPNILSYEAVFGEEYHKFGLGSPTVTTLLTYPYTRNVVGSMDFTPAALPVTSIPATAGFQLAETVIFESGTLNLASSIYAYEGNAALGFLNQVESSFEKSILIDKEKAEPGAYVAIARKSKTEDKWFVGAMTKKKNTTNISLDFLGDGDYNAAIFRDNEDGSVVVCEKKTVTKDTVIKEELNAAGGVAIVISKDEIELPAENCNYYEMEDGKAVTTAGDAVVTTNAFASGLKQVNMGYGETNHITCKVSAEKAGVYEMALYYKAGTDSQIAYKINGGSAVKTGLICSGTNSIAKYSCFVELKAGENTIECYNPNANFIGIDRLGISKTTFANKTVTKSDETDYGFAVDEEALSYSYTEYKAVDGTTNAVKEAEGYVGWLGGNSTSYLTVKINVSKAGTYKMRLGYMTGAKRDVYISINDGTAQKLTCASTGGYGMDSLGYLFTDVKLKAGSNTIKFTNPSADCPNIYSVGISTIFVEEKNVLTEQNTSGTQTTGQTDTTKKTNNTVSKVTKLKVKNKKKKKVVVSFNKVSGAKGYQIQYAKNKKFTKGKKSKTTKKVKYTVKNLKKKQTYYFRVRAYKLVDGVKKYGKWSAVKKVKITK